MTTTTVTTDHTRKTAFVAGILYLATFASSIPALWFLEPVLSDPNYIVSGTADGRVAFGVFLDLVNALTAIGTAVALFSVTRRVHEGLALGFVMTRMFEAAVIVIGIVSILSVLTLRQTVVADADPRTLVTIGQALVAVRDWTFILGPGMASLNALLLGTLMYRSRLVPRVIPAIGLVGAPVFLSFVAGAVLGITELGTAWHLAGGAPMFVWELTLGLWMTLKGFRRPELSGAAPELAVPAAA